MSNIQKIIGIIVGMAAVVSIFFGAENYFAKAAYVAAGFKVYDQRFKMDEIKDLKRQMNDLQIKYIDKPKSIEAMKLEQKLKEDLEKANTELDDIRKEK